MEHPEEDMSSFGIDYDGPLPSNEYDWDTWNDFSVQVPEILCPLSNTPFNRMKCTVDPLEESSCYGIDIYIKSLEIVDELSTLAFVNWCWDKNTLPYLGFLNTSKFPLIWLAWHVSFTILHVCKQYFWTDEVASTLRWKSFQILVFKCHSNSKLLTLRKARKPVSQILSSISFLLVQHVYIVSALWNYGRSLVHTILIVLLEHFDYILFLSFIK